MVVRKAGWMELDDMLDFRQERNDFLMTAIEDSEIVKLYSASTMQCLRNWRSYPKAIEC